MARTKYTVTFPAAKAGDEVTWPNAVKVYADANIDRPMGNGYIEAAAGSFTGWSDAASVTFTRAGTDSVTVTTGSPTGTGVAVPTAASSAPGTPVLKAFAFDHTTPGLTAGVDTGYTPAAGEILLDAWFDVVEAWNGTTPMADLGFYQAEAGSTGTEQTNSETRGFFGFQAGGLNAWDLSSATVEYNNLPDFIRSYAGITGTLAEISGNTNNSIVPATFVGGVPVKVVVSQTGQAGGAAAGATQGQAVLYMLVVTPPNS